MAEIPNLQIIPLHPDFQLPKQATDGSAGFDLHMPEAGHIPAGGKVKVGLGFATAIPNGYVGLLAPLSGVGSKVTLEVANTIGFIDSDYRGEYLPRCGSTMTMSLVDELDETVRGEGGHGSSGT